MTVPFLYYRSLSELEAFQLQKQEQTTRKIMHEAEEQVSKDLELQSEMMQAGRNLQQEVMTARVQVSDLQGAEATSRAKLLHVETTSAHMMKECQEKEGAAARNDTATARRLIDAQTAECRDLKAQVAAAGTQKTEFENGTLSTLRQQLASDQAIIADLTARKRR